MRLGPGTQPVPARPLVKGRLPGCPARQAPPAEVPERWPVQRTQVQLRVRQAAEGKRGQNRILQDSKNLQGNVGVQGAVQNAM